MESTTTQEAQATNESPPSEAPIEPSQTGLTPEGTAEAVNGLAFDPRSLPEDLTALRMDVDAQERLLL